MIERIGTVAIYVEDQDRALEFWTERVGFVVIRRDPMGAIGEWVEVAPADGQSCLALYPRSAMADWHEKKPSIVFECDDIDSTYAAMVENGVEFTDEPKAMPWGSYATFRDPDGNEYLLRAPRGEGAEIPPSTFPSENGRGPRDEPMGLAGES